MIRSHFGSKLFCSSLFRLFFVMELDPDGIVLGGAALSEPLDDPDGITLGAAAAPPPAGGAPRVRVGRPRDAPTSGRFLAWVTGTSDVPETGDASASAVSPGLSVFGIAECWWLYEPVDAENVEMQRLLTEEGVRSRQRPAWGALHYKAIEVWSLEEAFPLAGDDWNLEDVTTPTLLFSELRNRQVDTGSGDSRTVEQMCEERPGVEMTCLQDESGLAERLLTYAMPLTWRTVRLGASIPWAELVFGHPLRCYVNRWKKDAGARKSMVPRTRGRDQPSVEDLVVELPAPKRRMVETVEGEGASAKKTFNPLHWVRCVYFSSYLKDQKDFTAAMGASHAVDHSDEESGDRDASRDPGPSTLRRTLSKIDVMAHLLWRREFHAARVHDLIFSVNLYTDSSPVGGHELQGLVMDVTWKDGREERITLPGTSLAYGLFDAVNKTMGLVHALWLLTGPEYEGVWYLCTKVVSTTTDMGIERETLGMPNMVRAYCQYMCGTPFDQCLQGVDRSMRWLPHALRIGGWSHAWGNIAKAVANKVVKWPKALESMRALVAFWRVETWRSHVTKMLKREGVATEIVAASTSFRGTFAKWRYETIALSMSELLQLRIICQRHMRVEWFNNAQDREQLKAVFDACGDEWLWHFMEAGHRECIGKIEGCRRWGMVCEHETCQQKRREGAQHVPCFGNSRRLGGAWQFVQDQAKWFEERAKDITEADCENDREMWSTVKHMLRQTASMARQRFAYLGDPPWSAVKCETVEGAQNFVAQVESVPLEQHDDLTRDILQRVGECIRKRARGEELEPPLAMEVKRLKTSPLDEGAGEGLHRSLNKELTRADASTTVHLKQTCRRKGSIAHIKQFVRRYGKRGEAVVAWEFKHWKRILQGNRRRKWQNVQRSPKDVLATVYREDEGAGLNWQALVAPAATPRPVVTESADDQTKCEHEYLRAVLVPGEHYSCQVPREVEVAGSGANPPAPAMETSYFQFLGFSYGSHRPKLMHTATSADELALTASMAMEIVPHAAYARDVDAVECPPGYAEVYPDGDAKWLVPHHIAQFHDFLKSLMVWRQAEHSTTAGCELWSQSERALVKFNVLDDACPTLSIIYHLKAKGWVGEKARQVHRTSAIAKFGQVEATKFKAYYQVLAVLDRCLPLTSYIPSRQCINFYKCLLRGLEVLPDRSSKDYQIVINKDKRKRGTIIDLLPVEDAPAELPALLDRDGIMMGGAEQPPEPPQPRRQPSVATGSKRRPSAKPKPPAAVEPITDVGGPSGGAGGQGGGGGDPGCPPGPDDDGIVLGGVDTAPAGPPRGSGGEALRAPPRAQVPPKEVPGLFGLVVRYQPYKTTAGRGYPNFKVSCTRHTPPRIKTKGMLPSNCREHGEIEPLCFLHAWNGYDDPSGIQKHSQVNPPPHLVAAMAAQHGPELQAILDSCDLG